MALPYSSTTVDPDDPSQGSSEYRSMMDTWNFISDVLAGAKVMRRSSSYLHKYEGESTPEYERRKAVAPWRPEFEDCLRGLVSRPFTKDVSLQTPVSARYKELAEDIDGRGNNLTQFARDSFFMAMAKGVHLILVDYPEMHPRDGNPSRPLTVAEEKASGARPYWLQVEANDILALYTAWVNGREIISHLRIRENFIRRNGKFGETKGVRVRVYEPGEWWVYERLEGDSNFVETGRGVINRGGKFVTVPAVMFFTGERVGDLAVKPPLEDLAEMQLELFRAQSRHDEMLTYAGSPILAANGMKKPESGAPLTVGPKSILYAGTANASYNYIQPDAQNLKEVRLSVESIIEDMKRLGMQPLVERTGRQTATGDAIEAAKSHSAVQAWAMGLKDVLEQAFVITGQWLGETTYPEVTVYTDFSAVPASKAPLDSLATARAEGDLSRRTFWTGLQRYDVLPQDFDADKEEELLKIEANQPRPAPPMVKRDPVTGEAVTPQPPVQVPASLGRDLRGSPRSVG